MTEDKHTEWKESWGDEHLKAICAFANAQGGMLEIGKNDKGQFVGISRASASKLLEKLPSKINAILGIIPEIDHIKEQGKSLLQIKVKSYKNPISYRGRFYYRSGSTNQELRGNELFDFLLGKMGRSWDGLTIPSASINELDSETLAKFRKLAVESKRLPDDILEESNEELIKNQLKLTEDDALKRAGILLFHPDPEKYVTIQIRVYPDKIVFRNTCRLQAGWTVKDLTSKKQSEPYNPDIARGFFWANMIETWGRGIIQMQKACVAYGAPEPKIGGSESHIYVEFKNHDADMAKKLAKKPVLEETREKTPLKTPLELTLKTPVKILKTLAENPNITIPELAKVIDRSASATKRAVRRLRQLGYIERVGPDKGGYWKVIKKEEE